MSGEGLFKCTECGQKFHNQRQYSHHFQHRPHTADLPYKCESCPAGFPAFHTQSEYADHLMLKHVELTLSNRGSPSYIRTPNYVETILNRQYIGPSLTSSLNYAYSHMRHLPPTKPPIVTSNPMLRPSHPSPCASTELFKVEEWPSLDSNKYKTSGLCITGHSSEVDNPCCKHIKSKKQIESIPNDIRTYEKNKKGEWVSVPDRFDKPFISNQKTMKSQSETPKVEELEKEVEVMEGGEEAEEDGTNSIDVISDENGNTDDSSDESNYIEIDGPESVSEDPYRCPQCLKIIKNPTEQYFMVNQNFLISKI